MRPIGGALPDFYNVRRPRLFSTTAIRYHRTAVAAIAAAAATTAPPYARTFLSPCSSFFRGRRFGCTRARYNRRRVTACPICIPRSKSGRSATPISSLPPAPFFALSSRARARAFSLAPIHRIRRDSNLCLPQKYDRFARTLTKGGGASRRGLYFGLYFRFFDFAIHFPRCVIRGSAKNLMFARIFNYDEEPRRYDDLRPLHRKIAVISVTEMDVALLDCAARKL